MPRLQNKTYGITENQIQWLEEQSEKTGLQKVELVRRALDAFAEAEETKEQRRLFTPQQRREIKIIARRNGISEVEVVRQAMDDSIKSMFSK